MDFTVGTAGKYDYTWKSTRAGWINKWEYNLKQQGMYETTMETMLKE